MTEITLRKANQIEKKALAAARAIEVTLGVSVSIYEKNPIAQLVETTREKAQKQLDDALELTEAAYKIRALISAENAASGINSLMGERALLEAKERVLSPVVVIGGSRAETDEIEIAQRKLEALLKRSETGTATTRYPGTIEDSVNVTVLRPADLDRYSEMLEAVRDRKSAINDELMKRNWERRIDLDRDLIGVLKKHKIRIA